jgi:hypothetical protein
MSGDILSYHDFVRVIFQTAFVTVYFIFIFPDLDTNNMNNQSIPDSKGDAPTSQNGHTPVIFQTTEGQSVNLTEIIEQTVISPSFIESIGPEYILLPNHRAHMRHH